MDFDNTDALNTLAALPPVPPKTEKQSVWAQVKDGYARTMSAQVKGVGAAVYEGVAGLGEGLSAVGRGIQQMDQATPEDRRRNDAQGVSLNGQNEASRSLRNVAEELRPDPATAGTAEQVVFSLTKGLTKAVGYSVATGNPLAGAAAFGLDEGATAYDDLQRKGVDDSTAAKVGVVGGASAAAGMFLPVAGKTIVGTLGLVAAGGPAAFIAQQAASREILKRADYQQIAEQYDPLDPVGLAVSTLLPAAFGAHALRVQAKGNAPHHGADIADAAPETVATQNATQNIPEIIPARLTPEQADAVMTHNLTLAQDVRDATPPAEAVQKVAPARRPPTIDDEHISALPPDRAQQMVDQFAAAHREKPAFDEGIKSLAAEIGGKAKLAEIKGTDRAVAKVMVDYNGDPSKIKDLLRATIQVDSPDAAQAAVAGIFERYEVLPSGRRNLLDPTKEPADGYRDAKFNVLVNGHVAEVQVNVPAMLEAKKNGGHALYKEGEALRRQFEGEVMPVEVRAKFEAINAKMKALYDAAWMESTKAVNSGKETGAPFRWADEESKGRGGSVSQAMENLTPGASGHKDTGMPSTSNSSARGPKAGNFMATSDPIVRDSGKPGNQAVDALAGRVAEVERTAPDMVVRHEADGTPITAKQELERIRKEVLEGTDDTLGTLDAELLQVAAECALATGGL